jgi:uncharacterized membrane protein
MFCPNCGANNSTEQKFCRSCGLNLEQTAASLLEQIPSAESAKILRHEKFVEKFGAVALGGFGLVLATGIAAIIYTIVTRMIIGQGKVFFGVLLIAFLIFAFLSLVFVIFKEDLKERKQRSNPAARQEGRENELPSASRDTAKLLEDKAFEPVASVAEPTTDLLYVEQKTKKFE